MDSKILCNWLGIANWPPDHYALLGLNPGEGDVAQIEHQVHERMAKLRCYQLSHPEEATEGMNRVAQAFICLTETISSPKTNEKRDNGTVKPKQASGTNDTQRLKAVSKKTEIDWQQAPPPVRARSLHGTTDNSNAVTEEMPALPVVESASPQPAPPVALQPTSPSPTDAIHLLAHEHPEARRGLATVPAMIERINQTRQLLIAWNQAGKYLSNPAKKLSKPSDGTELTRRLNKIFELTADFPKFVGHPGQPGYRVVAMARLEMTAQMFKVLDEHQREALALDWDAGRRVLLSHRKFLRSQFKKQRRRGPIRLLLDASRGAINDHPVWVTLCLILVVGLCLFFYFK